MKAGGAASLRPGGKAMAGRTYRELFWSKRRAIRQQKMLLSRAVGTDANGESAMPSSRGLDLRRKSASEMDLMTLWAARLNRAAPVSLTV